MSDKQTADKLNTPQISEQIPRLGNAFSVWLGRSVLNTMGWSFKGDFPVNGKMIISVAPHTSNWDFVIGLAIAFSLRLKVSFFGKHSIFIPPFDRMLRRWGGIPIERTRSKGRVQQMVETMQNADKMMLCLAPEGTRSRVDNWKTGFLRIAYQAKVPVFLVSLDYKHKQIGLGPLMNIGENIPAEMEKIYQHYAKVHAKYPHMVSTSPTLPSGD